MLIPFVSMAVLMAGGITLHADTAPTITAQPLNQSVVSGRQASFSVSVGGDPAPSIQWYRSAGSNWNPVSGATSSTLILPATSPADNGAYFRAVAVNDAGSATSSNAHLTVDYVTITAQPQSVTVSAGMSVTFSATVSGYPAPTWQWYARPRGASNWMMAGSGSQPNATLTVTAGLGQDGTSYYLKAGNSMASTSSSTATLSVVPTPMFTTQPANVVTAVGASVTFSAMAAGNPAPTYQWQSCLPGGSWTNLPGATAPAFSLMVPDASLSGEQFRVVAANTYGFCTSSAASLTVLKPPTLSGLYAVPPLTGPGGTVNLVGVFTPGDGNLASAILTPGNLPVTSGVPLPVPVGTSPSTYTLNVMNSYGESASTSATVAPGFLRTLAGHPDGCGYLDGQGAAARFFGIDGIAQDPAGNLLVADWWNMVIRKVAPDGTVTTLAGTPGTPGSADDVGASASFSSIGGLVLDGAGNLLVSDGRAIRIVSPTGTVSTWAGSPDRSGIADGPAGTASFLNAGPLALAPTGILYVADSGVLRAIGPDGTVTSIAGSPDTFGSVVDGTGPAAHFGAIIGLALEPTGNLVVADLTCVRRVTPDGVVTTLAGASPYIGSVDGAGTQARFCALSGIAVGADGTIYVSDLGNRDIRAITPDGVVTTLAGNPDAYLSGNQDGTGSSALMTRPGALCQGTDGNLYFGDGGTQFPCDLRRITTAGAVTTLAGGYCVNATIPADGIGSQATFRQAMAGSVDLSGQVYVIDGQDRVRCVAPDGTVSTCFYASPGSAFQGVASDASGNLYITDSRQSVLWRVGPSGVSVVAGTLGVPGSADGPAAGSLLQSPVGVCVGPDGTVYVSDPPAGRIRTLSPAGRVGTLCTVDAFPLGALAIDSNGNLYCVPGWGNAWPCLLKITPSGTSSILAGSTCLTGYADGSSASATFASPESVATDPVGNVYVLDMGNNAVRVIAPCGWVGTLAGTPGLAGNIEGGLPSTLSTALSLQSGIAYNPATGGLVLVSGGGVMTIGR